MPSPQQKKLLKRKRNNITPLKINVPISRTSSESLKLTIQTYQMRNKKLKMKFGQLQEEISKASLPVSVDLRNDIKSFILDSDQKNLPHMRLSSKNIYNLLKIMLHFIPWTLMLMLRIRQSIYLILTNVLSSSFLMSLITFDKIRTTLSTQLW